MFIVPRSPEALRHSPTSVSNPCPSFPLLFVCFGAGPVAETFGSTRSPWLPSQGCPIPPHPCLANLTESGQFSRRTKVKSSNKFHECGVRTRGVEGSRVLLRDTALNHSTRHWRIPTRHCSPREARMALAFLQGGMKPFAVAPVRTLTGPRKGRDGADRAKPRAVLCLVPQWPCPTTLPEIAAVSPRGSLTPFPTSASPFRSPQRFPPC